MNFKVLLPACLLLLAACEVNEESAEVMAEPVMVAPVPCDLGDGIGGTGCKTE